MARSLALSFVRTHTQSIKYHIIDAVEGLDNPADTLSCSSRANRSPPPKHPPWYLGREMVRYTSGIENTSLSIQASRELKLKEGGFEERALRRSQTGKGCHQLKKNNKYSDTGTGNLLMNHHECECAVHRGMKNIGRQLSWCMPNPEYH